MVDTFKYDPKGSVRELMVKFHSGDTQTVNLDLNNNYIQTVTVDDVEYSIQLMNIGTENFDGKDYPKFEFLIESSTP